MTSNASSGWHQNMFASQCGNSCNFPNMHQWVALPPTCVLCCPFHHPSLDFSRIRTLVPFVRDSSSLCWACKHNNTRHEVGLSTHCLWIYSKTREIQLQIRLLTTFKVAKQFILNRTTFPILIQSVL